MWDDGMERQGNKKRSYFNKARYVGHKKHHRYDIRRGASGVLVTLGSSFRDHDESSEFLQLLDHEVPGIFNKDSGASLPLEKKKEEPCAADIHATIQNELKQEKNNSHCVTSFPGIIKGVSFFQFHDPITISPNDLIYHLLCRYMEANKINVEPHKEKSDLVKQNPSLKLSRFLHRLLPLDVTCSPHPINIYRAAQDLISQYFPKSAVRLCPQNFKMDLRRHVGDPEEADHQHANTPQHSHDGEGQKKKRKTLCPEADDSRDDQGDTASSEASNEYKLGVSASFTVPEDATWSIVLERRGGMKSVGRDEIIEKVGSYVGSAYKVNLCNPDFTILIQILPLFCGLSVVRQYNTLLHYNFHRLCHPSLYPSHGEKSET